MGNCWSSTKKCLGKCWEGTKKCSSKCWACTNHYCCRCWAATKEKASEWDKKLFDRKERSNPEGVGPTGKVSEDPPSRKNQDTNPNQDENYSGPVKQIPTDPSYNPNTLTITPKVKEEKIEPEQPGEEAVKLQGTIKYRPKQPPTKPAETTEQRRKRIEEAQIKQKAAIEEAKKRTEDDTKKLTGNVGDYLTNQYTNNKPVPAPVPKPNSNQTVPVNLLGNKDLPDSNSNPESQRLKNLEVAKPKVEIAEIPKKVEIPKQVKVKVSLGETPKKIPGLNLNSKDVFSEGKENQAKFASHSIVLPDCNWPKLHEQINGEYYDKEFPAAKESLQGHGKAKTQDDVSKLETIRNYQFKRLSYAIENVKVVESGISPNDIYQGQLGDCYYLSALASVAEYPERIERLLLQRETSTKGAYCVALNVLGEWISIVLDDIFPVKPRGGFPFCYTKTREIWAMLLEKAYAKVYGGFWNIGCGGISSEALKDITGAPCTYIDLSDQDQKMTALKTIEDSDKRNFIITCSSMGSGEHKGDNGIISGHAYTLVSFVKLNDGTELLKLRNPWGSGEWKGDWGDDSKLWNKAGTKEKAGWTSDDDGTFFMRFDDFCENFSAVTVCHYHDDYILSTVKGNNKDEQMDVKQFTINKKGSYYLGMSQPDQKQFGHDEDYDFGYLSCTILKKDGESFKYIDGFAYTRRDIWAKIELEEGSYLAIIYTNWNSANTQYSFWAYGPQNVPIKSVTEARNKDKCLDYLYDALLQDALTKNEDWKHMTNPGFTNIRYRFQYSSTGYGYYIFDNAVDNVKLTAVLSMEGENCEIVKPKPTGAKLELAMEPRDTKMAMYRVTNLPNSVNFSVAFKMRKTA